MLMSTVIDGEDILARNSYLAAVMSESLERLLNGKTRRIPAEVLQHAQKLFSRGVSYIWLKKGLQSPDPLRDQIESSVAYHLLTDMLKKVKDVPEKEVDSELEKLAAAINALTSDEQQVSNDRGSYQTLRDLFNAMCEESSKYAPELGQHSPYSRGTFDDGDDE